LPVEAKVIQKIEDDHKKLKQDGWEEWVEMNNLTVITETQKQMIKTAYDYGWYNAYGLESEDKRHAEMMEALKNLQDLTRKENKLKDKQQVGMFDAVAIRMTIDLKKVCEELLNVMDIQEKRWSEEFHLSAEAFKPIWDGAKQKALFTLSQIE